MMRKLLSIILATFLIAAAALAVAVGIFAAVDAADISPGECAPEVIPGAPEASPGSSPFLSPDEPERVETLKVAIVCERRDSEGDAVQDNYTVIFEDGNLTDLYKALGVEQPGDPDPIQIQPDPDPEPDEPDYTFTD